MREYSGFSRIGARGFVVLVAALLAACSSDGEQKTNALFGQAPHCASNESVLRIEGSVAGGEIDDTRTTNVNAGLENFGASSFYTPVTDLAPLAANQLAMKINWSGSLAYGDSSAIGSGTLTLPASHPSAGSAFCVSAGSVGFVDGGSEDGAFKFAITELKGGADCTGNAQAVDLRGCFQ